MLKPEELTEEPVVQLRIDAAASMPSFNDPWTHEKRRTPDASPVSRPNTAELAITIGPAPSHGAERP